MNYIGNNLDINVNWTTASGGTYNYSIARPDLSNIIASGTTTQTVCYAGKVNQIGTETKTAIRLNELYKNELNNPKIYVYKDFAEQTSPYNLFVAKCEANNAFLPFTVTGNGNGYIGAGDATTDYNNIFNWYNRPMDGVVNPQSYPFMNLANYPNGIYSDTPITLPITNKLDKMLFQTQISTSTGNGVLYPIGRLYYKYNLGFSIIMDYYSAWKITKTNIGYCFSLTTSMRNILSRNTNNYPVDYFAISFVGTPSPTAWDNNTVVKLFVNDAKPCMYTHIVKFVGRNSGIMYLPICGKTKYSEQITGVNRNDYYGNKVRYMANVTPTFELNTGWLTDGDEKINLVENLLTSNDVAVYDIANNAEYGVIPSANNFVQKEYDNENKALFYTLTFNCKETEKKY